MQKILLTLLKLGEGYTTYLKTMLKKIGDSLLLWSAAAVITTVGIGYAIWLKKKQIKIPRTWHRVGALEKIIMYPVKSCHGITVHEAECTDLGLRTTDNNTFVFRDRFFVISDSNSKDHANAKKFNKIVLIKIKPVDKGEIVMEAPGMSPIQVKVPNKVTDSNRSHCYLWLKDTVESADCGEEAAKWVSQYLIGKDSGLRLGCYIPESMKRRNAYKPPWKSFREYYHKLRSEDMGAYSDLSSYMLVTTPSVEDVDSKLPDHSKGIMPEQFRPNFIIRDCKPYEEDTWDWIKIGDNAIFRYTKPCVRCTITGINPENGIMNADLQPFRTLQSYRKVTDPRARKIDGDSPIMGAYIGLHVPGVVKTGDQVYVGSD